MTMKGEWNLTVPGDFAEDTMMTITKCPQHIVSVSALRKYIERVCASTDQPMALLLPNSPI
jgi:hypothetical protein